MNFREIYIENKYLNHSIHNLQKGKLYLIKKQFAFY